MLVLLKEVRLTAKTWLHRFQRCSETEALNIPLEESVRVSINVTLLIIPNWISYYRFEYRFGFFLFAIGKIHV